MLEILPPEIVLTILSFIPLRQLHRLSQVSRCWSNFINLNQSSIYHAAAILHGFIPAAQDRHDDQESLVSWTDARSWKEVCMESYRMERRWEGNGRARSIAVMTPGQTVWRFKVDLDQHTVITTHCNGGLRVSAIQEGQVLWSLPRSEVCPYAHCEYAEGFLVFTRNSEALEIWRRMRDARSNPQPSTLKPDSWQAKANRLAWQSPLSVSQDDRGAFVPWMTIIPPNPVRASRLVRSTLLVASKSAREAYLYDIRSGRQKQTIYFGDASQSPISVKYVELSPRHAFICTVGDVHVYPLDPKDTQTCVRFPSQVEGFREIYETRAFRVKYNLNWPIYSPEARHSSTLAECTLYGSFQRLLPFGDRHFQAVHVSPCGSHFVTVDKQGCVCIIRNFETVLRKGGSLSECLTIIDMGYPILNLAFEEDKRLVIYVQQHGIFVFPLVSENDASVDTLTLQPEIYPRVLHASQAGWHDDVQCCSCLQVTRSQLWYTLTQMHPNPAFNGVASSPLYCIDFAKSQ